MADARDPEVGDVPRLRRFDPVAALRASRTDAAPLEIGRYTLLDRIGRGGFGVVYRAYDPLLGREVAAKLLRSRVGAENTDALIHEARMAAQLQHPHVVRIFDVGRIEGVWADYGANVFIVMELLHGEPLHRWLRDERSAEEIVAVFLQAADGLAAAHQQGIVHCDVKPANVFVTESGEAKVLDFGLSRHSSQRSRTTLPPGTVPTDTGSHRIVAGTKPYMAPEAHSGREPDAAADQYSFALALIEALAGELPFSGGARGKLVGEKLQGVSRDWLKQRGIPRRLGEILVRATNPDPSHRYPGMDSFADDLRRWLHPGATKWWIAAAAVGVLAAVGIPSTAVDEPACELDPAAASERWAEARPRIDARWPASDPDHVRFAREIDGFVDDWSEAAQQACAPEQTPAVPVDDARVCLRERLGRLDAVLSIVTSADDAVMQHVPDLVAQFVPASYCLDPERAHELPPMPADDGARVEVTEIRDLLSLARAHHAAGSYAEGLRLAKLGLVRSTGGFEPARAEAMYETGILTIATGDLEGGAEYIEQAYLAAEGRKHDRLAAGAAVRLVSIYGRYLVQEERARAWARRSEVAIERLADQTKFRAALAYNLGLIEYSDGSLDLAREHFEAALALYEELEDERDARVCRMSLGAIEELEGDSEAALVLFKDAYDGARKSLGLQHPDTAAALSSLAGAQSSLGQLQVARGNLETALVVFEQTYGEEHHTVGSTLVNIGNVEFELGRYDDALANHERALRIFEAILPPGHPRTAITLENIAVAHMRRGDAEAARERLALALDMRLEQLDPTSPLLAHTHANLGLALANLARHDEAREQFDAAMTILSDASSGEADRASVLFRQAMARKLAGHRPLDDVRRALAGFEQRQSRSQLAEARFELAKLLFEDDPQEAREAAEQSLSAFRSMGADARAEPVKAWIDAHAVD